MLVYPKLIVDTLQMPVKEFLYLSGELPQGIPFLLFSSSSLIQSTVYLSPLSCHFLVYLCLTGSSYIVAA